MTETEVKLLDQVRMAENSRREAGNNKASEIAVARANLRSSVNASKLCAVDSAELIAHPTADLCADRPDDLDVTVELPVLVIDDAFRALGEGEKREQAEEATGSGRLEQPYAEERAPSWLQRLESDIHRMQEKWESAAADLRIRVAKVQELSSHVKAQDVLVDDLHRQVCEQTSARITLETDLKQAAARLTDLVTDQAACDFNVAQTQSDLQEAWEAIAVAESNRAATDKARFRDSIERRAEAAAGAHGRSGDDPSTSDLRARIEELETYIDGNNARWSALQEKIAEYRDAHRASERRVADAQARLIAETASRDRLWAEAADLRRCLEELAAHLAERDIEQRKLTRRLEEQRAAATHLRDSVASARARSSQALDELKSSKQRVAELEVLVLARDETIAGLVRRASARDRAEGELLASKKDVEGHVAALELELRLAVEATAQKEVECRDAQQKLVMVEALLREASHEIDGLVTAIEEKEETILCLEADLRTRQDAVSMIDHGTDLFR